jgi:hypothetical protein
MAFMEPEIYHGAYAAVTSKSGETAYCPSGYEEVDDDDTLEIMFGYLGRLSASGYMDATDWSPLTATTYDTAVIELCDEQDICPKCFEQCWDDETPCDETEGE